MTFDDPNWLILSLKSKVAFLADRHVCHGIFHNRTAPDANNLVVMTDNYAKNLKIEIGRAHV